MRRSRRSAYFRIPKRFALAVAVVTMVATGSLMVASWVEPYLRIYAPNSRALIPTLPIRTKAVTVVKPLQEAALAPAKSARDDSAPDQSESETTPEGVARPDQIPLPPELPEAAEVARREAEDRSKAGTSQHEHEHEHEHAHVHEHEHKHRHKHEHARRHEHHDRLEHRARRHQRASPDFSSSRRVQPAMR